MSASAVPLLRYIVMFVPDLAEVSKIQALDDAMHAAGDVVNTIKQDMIKSLTKNTTLPSHKFGPVGANVGSGAGADSGTLTLTSMENHAGAVPS